MDRWNKWLKVKVSQSCLTLWEPMDYTVHGILQARILEWVAFPFFRRSSQPRDRTQVSRITGRFLTSWATGEAQMIERSSQDKTLDTFPSVLLISCQTSHTALPADTCWVWTSGQAGMSKYSFSLPEASHKPYHILIFILITILS